MSNNALDRTVALIFIVASIGAACANAAERELVPVTAPDHDPLYVDRTTIHRNGDSVSFNYVLDVLAIAEQRTAPGGWKSNEIEATINCALHTFVSGRITAYAGPRASGGTVGGYVPSPPERVTEKISPKSTFAYLEVFVCAKN
jgi:hypothetical protein